VRQRILSCWAALSAATLGAGSGLAGEADGKKAVIKLKTPGLELAETDISHLRIGGMDQSEAAILEQETKGLDETGHRTTINRIRNND
jgi:hypothetical protein